MHDTLKEPPSIRFHVIKVLSHSCQPLGSLRPCINLERKAVVLDRFYDGSRCISGNLGCTRTAAECDFAEESAVWRRKNSQYKVFALNGSPAEWTWLQGFFPRLQIAKQHTPCMVLLGFEAIGESSIICSRVCFSWSECHGQINEKVGLAGWALYASVDADGIARRGVLRDCVCDGHCVVLRDGVVRKRFLFSCASRSRKNEWDFR